MQHPFRTFVPALVFFFVLIPNAFPKQDISYLAKNISQSVVTVYGSETTLSPRHPVGTGSNIAYTNIIYQN